MRGELTKLIITPQGRTVALNAWGELLGHAARTRMGALPSVKTSSPASFPVTHVGLHFGEEPFLHAGRGTATVYFASCNLRCVDCMNDPAWPAFPLTPEELSDELHGLVRAGAASIDFVSPTLYWKPLLPVLERLKETLPGTPVIYNCGGYESVGAIAEVAAHVDVFLPDGKGRTLPFLRERNLPADYAYRFSRVLPLMAQDRPLVWDGALLKRGTVVRHLLVPHHEGELVKVLDMLRPFAESLLVNVMTRYYAPKEKRIIPLELPSLPGDLRTAFHLYRDGEPL
jgi:putative pyruvate formate lyase activating enzyme